MEKLIRAFQKLYKAKTETNLDKCRHQIDNAKLVNFDDLDSFFSFREERHAELAGYPGETFSESNKRYYLLKGLPTEYQPAKTAAPLLGINSRTTCAPSASKTRTCHK